MVQVGTVVNIVDNTGVLTAKCIKVLNKKSNSFAKIGDVIIVIIKTYTLKKGFLANPKKRSRFVSGKKYRALVLRAKGTYTRMSGVNLQFFSNDAILVNKKKVPLGSRFKGPVVLEMCYKRNAVSSLAPHII